MITSGSYNPILTVLSVLIAILGSYTALDLAGRVTAAQGAVRRAWLAGGSIAMGVGIWSMHFIGMLAFRMPGIPVFYDGTLWLASIVIAIVASLLALHVVSAPTAREPMVRTAGLLMGGAIAGMHYTGMAAMRVPGRISYDPALVLASIVIAVLTSVAALRLSLNFQKPASPGHARGKVLGAMLMGLAISGMHYTAMAAAHFVPNDSGDPTTTALLATDGLAAAVAIGTILILTLALLGAMMDRRVRRQLQETEAAAGLARREAEEALHESRDRFQTAFRNAPIGMALVDLDGRWLEVNQALCEIVGYTADELLSRTFQDITHPDDLESDLALMRQLRTGEIPSYQLEKRYIRPGGAMVWTQLTASMVCSAEGEPLHFVAQVQDVTGRRSMEEQLRQAQRAEAIGRLAGGIAHDFNNLLTVIGGNAGFLIDTMPDEHPDREALSEIVHATARAADLTRQLLAFGRRQILQPRDVDLNAILLSTDRLIRRVIGKDVEVITIPADGGAPVHVDPGQIEQVVLNLAINARDAMPEGGRMTLEVRVEGISPAGGAADSDGPRAVLEVRDTGHGMEPAILSHIFEPYFTTKEQGKGTGLGLSMALGIAEQSGGTLRAESVPGHGSTFRLLLPLRERALPVDAASAPAKANLPGSGALAGTVLLVDDQDSVRILARRMLSRAGLTVLEASNGEAGLRKWEGHRREIDLVVTDLEMPLMGGVEMMDRIHTQDADVRVIYISGHKDDWMWRGEADPTSLFVAKPFEMESFLGAVRRLMRPNGSHTV